MSKLDALPLNVSWLSRPSIWDSGKFRTKDCEIIQTYPGVSKETIRSVLKSNPDCFVYEGRGVSARWLKVKNLSS